MDSHFFPHSQTDMMQRRTLLPFCGRFLWRGTYVSIRTDSQLVLLAAEQVGLLPQTECDAEPDMHWEIACERGGTASGSDWMCRAVADLHSLFLSMGREQWFALDLETGDGAGFIVVPQDDACGDPGAVKYLRDLTHNITNFMRNETGRNERS